MYSISQISSADYRYIVTANGFMRYLKCNINSFTNFTTSILITTQNVNDDLNEKSCCEDLSKV